MSLLPRAFSHVLFDLDGVLLDTEPLYTTATQSIVGRFGKTYDFAVKQHTMGRDARVSAKIVIDMLGVPLTPEEFLAERGPILRQLLADSPPMPGAESFVRELARRAVPIAVATSSDRDLYCLKTAPHEWFSLFDAVVCGNDPGVTAKKPAPDIFLLAARKLGAAPEECLVVEDSPAGVEAALAAGMQVVAVPDPAMEPSLYDRAHLVLQSLHTRLIFDLGF